MVRLPRWDAATRESSASNRHLEYELNRELELLRRELAELRETAELSLSGRVIPASDLGTVTDGAGTLNEGPNTHVEIFGGKRVQATIRIDDVPAPGSGLRRHMFDLNELFRPSYGVTGGVGGMCRIGSAFYAVSGTINTSAGVDDGVINVVFPPEAVNADGMILWLTLNYEF